MVKLAYEFGVKCAMVDAGLMTKEAIPANLLAALGGAGVGGVTGAALAPEGSGLSGALLGAGLGAAGTVGAKKLLGGKVVQKLRHAGEAGLASKNQALDVVHRLRQLDKHKALLRQAKTLGVGGLGGGAIAGGAAGGALSGLGSE